MLADLRRLSLQITGRSGHHLNMFRNLSVRDLSMRLTWMEFIRESFESWFRGSDTPRLGQISENSPQSVNYTSTNTSLHHLIYDSIPELIRIVSTCPLEDVRTGCLGILNHIEEKFRLSVSMMPHPSPSYCFAVEDLPYTQCIFLMPTSAQPLYDTYDLFRKQWYDWGRVDNFVQIMGCRPEFLESFLNLHAHIFSGDLPLPTDVRYYVAILAAVELRCPNLACLFSYHFVHAGGNTAWLEVPSTGAKRWNQLHEINHTLAHCPWKINQANIFHLIGGPDSQLLLPEVMHAIAIMTHVHSLVCLIYGACVRPEQDVICSLPPPYPTARPPSTSHPRSVHRAHCDPQKNQQEYKRRNEAAQVSFESFQLDAIHSHNNDDNKLVEEIFKCYARVNKNLNLTGVGIPSFPPEFTELEFHPVIARFLPTDYRFRRWVDFEGSPFVTADFSWLDDAAPVVDHLVDNLGTILDDFFDNGYDLVNKISDEFSELNTPPFRQTLSNFVQSLFGVCYEDFSFDKAFALLSLRQRSYLKVLATRPYELLAFPPTICREVFPNFCATEIIHILIMVMGARHRACISYAVRLIAMLPLREE